MTYRQLLRHEPRPLLFATANALFSSLGQSHFLALFSLTFMQKLNLTALGYGILYATATLASAALLPVLGPVIDHIDIRKYCLGIGLTLLGGLAALAFSNSSGGVFLALFALRLSGQGLCTHVNGVSTARYFGANRGKALGLTNMGFPLAEGLLTPLLALSLTRFGLEMNVGVLALSVIAIYLPITSLITRHNSHFNFPQSKPDESDHRTAKVSWTPTQVLKSRIFYLLMLHSVFPAFSLSGFLVYQASLAHAKGWPLNTIAVAMSVFAIGRLVSAFFTGYLVDRWGSLKLFPFYQLPLSMGFLCLWWVPQVHIVTVGMLLCGITVGAAAPIKSSMWAELYGIGHLGAVKSMFATMIVVVTALSPLFFGMMIDAQLASQLLLGLGLFSLITASLSTVAIRLHRGRGTGFGPPLSRE